MKNDSLIKALDKYLIKDKCDGAFYINGPWGSGKTYFIKKYMEEKEDAQYISLDGMKSVNDINEELFAKLNPAISKIKNSKISKVLINIVGSIIGTKIGVDISNIDLENFVNKANFNIKILVLDDLERTKIDIQELFGYISSLLTVSEIKVILIGNDEEVRKYLDVSSNHNSLLITAILSKDLDKFNENKIKVSEPLLYDKIKEKSIYKQYNFAFDEDVLFKEISKSFKISTQKLLRRNKESIKYVLHCCGCNNLRTCQIALENYEEIAMLLNKKFINDLKVKSFLFIETFIYTVIDKMGHGSFADFTPFSYETECREIDEIKNYVQSSAWNKITLLKKLESVDVEISVTTCNKYPETLKKVNSDWYLKSDEILRNEIYDLKNDLNNIDVQYYCKIIDLFALYLDWFGNDENIDLDTIYQIMTKKVNDTKDVISFNQFNMFFCNCPEVSKEYIEKLEKLIIEHNSDINAKTTNDVIANKNEFTTDDLKKIKDDSLDDKCFFGKVDVDNIINIISEGDAKDVLNIISIFKSVYSFDNLKDFYKADLNNLEQFKEKLKTIKNDSVIKQRAIKLLNEELEKYIRKLL